ncbi:hypothetical protein [Nostoc sp. LPT]|nr:hypothetical protein [Nostoc sp. LPT]MBN4003899.1 hypothetical protein [Nostoc sp. LPT]
MSDATGSFISNEELYIFEMAIAVKTGSNSYLVAYFQPSCKPHLLST